MRFIRAESGFESGREPHLQGLLVRLAGELSGFGRRWRRLLEGLGDVGGDRVALASRMVRWQGGRKSPLRNWVFDALDLGFEFSLLGGFGAAFEFGLHVGSWSRFQRAASADVGFASFEAVLLAVSSARFFETILPWLTEIRRSAAISF